MKAAICQPQMGKEALLGLLSAKSEGERAFVFDAAREARHRAFGNKVFLYGFLYLSTHCRNDCAFCQYRRSNSSLERYRKPLGEMLEAAGRLAADGVHLLDLTLGEDPYYVEPAGFHRLVVGAGISPQGNHRAADHGVSGRAFGGTARTAP